tara:strand:- start:14457 stop:14846 length:390 start_codon:yes stop_codon:yes gene_type:complete
MTKSKTKEKKNYFSKKELRCRHTGKHGFDDGFLETLNAIREECGFPFVLTSAYRDPSHPAESHKTATGSHALGKAVDIRVTGAQAIRVIEVALKHGITRIGVQQKGMGRFIHIDGCTEEDGKPTAVWSY